MNMSCSHSKNCELFAQFALNPALKVWQSHFCESEFKRCIRYQRALEGKSVPLNLLPNGKMIEVPRTTETYGAVALFNAIMKERVSMIDSLIKSGAEVNITNPDGTTPLMAAAEKGNPEMVRLLLAKGADVSIKSVSGETADQIAQRCGFPEVAALIKDAGGRAQLKVVPAQTSVVGGATGSPKTPAPATGTNDTSARIMPLAKETATAADKPGQHAYFMRVPVNYDRDTPKKFLEIFNSLSIRAECIMQKRPAEGQTQTAMFVVTHPTSEQSIRLAIIKIGLLPAIAGHVNCKRMEDLPAETQARRVS
jgi:hypothetical protein